MQREKEEKFRNSNKNSFMPNTHGLGWGQLTGDKTKITETVVGGQRIISKTAIDE